MLSAVQVLGPAPVVEPWQVTYSSALSECASWVMALAMDATR